MKFASDVLAAVDTAAAIAKGGEISGEHLIIALVISRTKAGDALIKLGFTLEEAQLRINSASGTGTDGTMFSTNTQNSLILAQKFADEAGCMEVHSHHLLLAIAKSGDRPTAKLLGEYGISEYTIESIACTMNLHKIGEEERSEIRLKNGMNINEALHKKIMAAIGEKTNR